MQPGAEGDRVDGDLVNDIDLKFHMDMFYDDKFEKPYDKPVDIGALSYEDSRIYIKARAEISNTGNFAVHLKECDVKNYRINEDGSETLLNIIDGAAYDEKIFMADGCGLDTAFAQRNLGKFELFNFFFVP